MGPAPGNAIAMWVMGAGLLLALVGLILMRRGLWPRRVGRTPHCPKCDYALTGLLDAEHAEDPVYLTTFAEPPLDRPDGPPVRCPECGRRVSWRTAVIGDRPGRKGWGWVGAVILLAGLTVAGVVGVGKLRGVDWIRWKWAGWLIRDLRSADVASRDAAWTEIGRRLAEKSFPESSRADLDAAAIDALAADASLDATVGTFLRDRFAKLAPEVRRKLVDHWAAQLTGTSFASGASARDHVKALLDADALGPDDLARLTAAALARQLAASQPGAPVSTFDDFLFGYLGDRAARNLLPEPARTQFFEQGLTTSLGVRPVVVEGGSLPYEVRYTGRGPQEGWQSKEELNRAEIDGRVVDEGSWGGGGSGFALGSHGASTRAPGPGKHVLTVVLTRSATYQQDPPGANGERPTRFAKQFTMVAPFEVLPRGSTLPMTWVDDPTVGERLRQSIKPRDARLKASGYERFSVVLDLREIPVGIAFRVVARIDGKEYPMGTIGAAKGRSTAWHIGTGEGVNPPTGVATCDIVLRSDAAGAASTIDVFEAWRGELVYRDVPVTNAK